ncbi:MAG: hypothetical protein CME70_11430 [Halobacteriovorax sp.]|nr:hypothetical protein [Halobacteriovorax sp.]|tara:strand:- start:68964 stop:69317 length:354 start_codon:yes stop_codon:yes gene_type:complete
MKLLLIFITLAFSASAFSGPGHGHSHGPVDTCKKLATKDLKKSSIKIGKCHILRFVKAGKIESSWRAAKHLQSEIKKFGGKEEWIVTFHNEKGTKGKKLFVFLNMKGGFIAANFTGK